MAGRARAVLGSLVFFLIAPGVVAGGIPYVISRWRIQPPLPGGPAGRIVGACLIVIGVAALVECFARFAIQGRGTPAPVAPTRRLIVSGLYRHVRNPMYVAVVATILGQGLLLANVAVLGYAGVMWGIFHVFILAYEEPTLRKQFGTDYELYRAHVRRWWPRARPWVGPPARV